MRLTSKITKTAAAVAICSVLAIANPKGIFSPLESWTLRVVSPFARFFRAIGNRISDEAEFLSSIGQLKRENEALLDENAGLSAAVAELSQEKDENRILRDQLGLAPRQDYDLVSAFVSAQDVKGLESWIYVNKGTDDGITAGMPVIVSNGILIGFVSEAYADNAKIDLLTAPSTTVNAADVATGSRGIIQGEYGLGLDFGMVSQSDAVNEGDDIVTSGLGSDIPKGLLIGKVKEVHPSASGLFQEATVIPRIRYSKLDVVFVIRGKK